MRSLRSVPWALALLAGVAQAASIASPWDGQPQWWLQLASLAVLARLLHLAPSARAGAGIGGLFATAWLAGTFWWLFISMHTYGGLAAPLAVAAVLALAAFLALYYALAAGLYVRCGSRNPFLFAALWLGAELMRASWFTGFPWGAGGYAHVDGPLAPMAGWIGVYGIGAVAALLAGAGALLFRLGRGQVSRALAIGGLAALGFVAIQFADPQRPPAPGGKLTVALLQGNIPQDEKFQGGTGIPLALRWYGEQFRDSRAALTVAPETAIPMPPQFLPEGYFDALRQRFAQGGQAALLGLPLGNSTEGYTNSVVGWKEGGVTYRYDKHHLVPFGEFIPPFFKWFTRMMNIPLGDFDRGSLTQPSFEFRGQRLAPNICYEDLFAEDLAERFADAARAPTIFVNVSNIGWFGNSIAIDQHLQISRMRALEFARPMVRATNTGATVVIDRFGRVTHSLPRLTRGVLQAEVEGGSGLTPYAGWLARAGLWPLWALALAGVAASLRRRP